MTMREGWPKRAGAVKHPSAYRWEPRKVIGDWPCAPDDRLQAADSPDHLGSTLDVLQRGRC